MDRGLSLSSPQSFFLHKMQVWMRLRILSLRFPILSHMSSSDGDLWAPWIYLALSQTNILYRIVFTILFNIYLAGGGIGEHKMMIFY